MADEPTINTKLPQGTHQVWSMRTRQSEDVQTPMCHEVTLDFSDVSIGELMTEASRNIKVRLQGQIRKHPERFPQGELTVKVSENLGGKGGVVLTKASVLAAARQDEKLRKELLEELRRLEAQADEARIIAEMEAESE